jgi:AraC-like DNA-binding protein
MITKESIQNYRGKSLNLGSNYLYISPHILLQPYIANYTITFPTSQTMPDAYTVLPTASSTLIISVSADSIFGGLRGVNTKACNVGAHANKMHLLLLIEFHPGGLHPFIHIDQFELLDSSFPLEDLDKTLNQTLEDTLLSSASIESLIDSLDYILLAKLRNRQADKSITTMMQGIIKRHGNISAKELSSEFYYSEKHIRRLFLHQVGTTPKIFSRIVRANYALHLLQTSPAYLTDIGVSSGFFDQPHFIHDFKMVCGLTPMEYKQNMSLFYNDQFKM